MVDRPLVLRKFAELERHLAQVKEITPITVEAYSKDWKVQRVAERTLQIMIELCVDIANHVISDKGYRVPVSYADTFKVLKEEGILHGELQEAMEKMAKFRNILVHHYDRIEPSIMVDILNHRLKDFLRYREAILSCLG
ncbi:MAG: DUF86 domain-containing protein [Candidatus Brocadiaceae bacterium]|nr:DUF86 domain-containing protein [Candidatus Brocadiaceae bacterium]